MVLHQLCAAGDVLRDVAEQDVEQRARCFSRTHDVGSPSIPTAFAYRVRRYRIADLVDHFQLFRLLPVQTRRRDRLTSSLSSCGPGDGGDELPVHVVEQRLKNFFSASVISRAGLPASFSAPALNVTS